MSLFPVGVTTSITISTLYTGIQVAAFMEALSSSVSLTGSERGDVEDGLVADVGSPFHTERY